MTSASKTSEGHVTSASSVPAIPLWINGKKVPVIGRVTMDMTMLDVTDLNRVDVGDEVVIVGKQGRETLEIEDVARWAGTSPYEIFCGIAGGTQNTDGLVRSFGDGESFADFGLHFGPVGETAIAQTGGEIGWADEDSIHTWRTTNRVKLGQRFWRFDL